MEFNRPIAIALLIMATVMVGFFMTAPAYQDASAAQLLLAQKQAEYRAQFDYYGDIAKQYNDLQNRPDDLKKLDDALPQDPELGQLVHYFQREARISGLTLRNLVLAQVGSKNDAKSNANTVQDLVFALEVYGNYDALKNFIIDLEKSDRIFEVTAIAFGGNGQTGFQPDANTPQDLFNFSVQIKTHSY